MEDRFHSDGVVVKNARLAVAAELKKRKFSNSQLLSMIRRQVRCI